MVAARPVRDEEGGSRTRGRFAGMPGGRRTAAAAQRFRPTTKYAIGPRKLTNDAATHMRLSPQTLRDGRR
jgi:hypothetical protein